MSSTSKKWDVTHYYHLFKVVFDQKPYYSDLHFNPDNYKSVLDVLRKTERKAFFQNCPLEDIAKKIRKIDVDESAAEKWIKEFKKRESGTPTITPEQVVSLYTSMRQEFIGVKPNLLERENAELQNENAELKKENAELKKENAKLKEEKKRQQERFKSIELMGDKIKELKLTRDEDSEKTEEASEMKKETKLEPFGSK